MSERLDYLEGVKVGIASPIEELEWLAKNALLDFSDPLPIELSVQDFLRQPLPMSLMHDVNESYAHLVGEFGLANRDFNGADDHGVLSQALKVMLARVGDAARRIPYLAWLFVTDAARISGVRDLHFIYDVLDHEPRDVVWRPSDLSDFMHAPLQPLVADVLTAILELTLFVEDLQIALRRIAKGQVIRFSRKVRVAWDGPPQIEAAIELRDQRRFAEDSLLGAAAGTASNFGITPEDPFDEVSAILVSIFARPDFPPLELKKLSRRYDPWHISLINLRRAWPSDLISRNQATLNNAQELSIRVAEHAMAQTLPRRTSWSRNGLLVVDGATLEQEILSSGRLTLDDYYRLRADPSSGFHELRDSADLLVDLATFNHWLIGLIARVPNTDVNQWGKHFELGVQGQVDKSSWRPEGALRTLIGRRVKRADGSTVTDIDAVADHPDATLLIDAKSHELTDELLLGAHRQTENTRKRVEAEAEAWRQKTQWIAANPSSIGCPGGTGKPIVGVVVTSTVPYVHLGLATEVLLPGLRRVTTMQELLKSMSGHD